MLLFLIIANVHGLKSTNIDLAITVFILQYSLHQDITWFNNLVPARSFSHRHSENQIA